MTHRISSFALAFLAVAAVFPYVAIASGTSASVIPAIYLLLPLLALFWIPNSLLKAYLWAENFPRGFFQAFKVFSCSGAVSVFLGTPFVWGICAFFAFCIEIPLSSYIPELYYSPGFTPVMFIVQAPFLRILGGGLHSGSVPLSLFLFLPPLFIVSKRLEWMVVRWLLRDRDTVDRIQMITRSSVLSFIVIGCFLLGMSGGVLLKRISSNTDPSPYQHEFK